jgi:glycosyltransferase involved in cell wall biosynthesis
MSNEPTLPRISVVIAVRNSVNTIGKALDSVLAQHYPNVELIVLDALSDDGTLDVIKRYERHIAHLRCGKDDGANDAYNEGIRKASGGIIAFLNADDWYEPGILHKIGAAYAADPSIDIVTCEAQVWKDDGSGTLVRMKHFAGKSMQMTPLGTPMPNARFWNKSIFERFGFFMVRNHLGQRIIASDLEFMMRVCQHPIKNHLITEVGYHYLMHAGSLTFGGDKHRDRQMYLERAHIAQTYLSAPALKKYRARLKRWHRRGTSRNFYWQLEEKNYRKAWDELSAGCRISGPLWLAETLRIGLSRHF